MKIEKICQNIAVVDDVSEKKQACKCTRPRSCRRSKITSGKVLLFGTDPDLIVSLGKIWGDEDPGIFVIMFQMVVSTPPPSPALVTRVTARVKRLN